MSRIKPGFFRTVMQRLLGSDNSAIIRKLKPTVEKINALEEQYQSLSDEELRAKTDEFRARIEARRNELFAEVRKLQAEFDALDDDEKAQQGEEYHKRIHAAYQDAAQRMPRIRKNKRLARLAENDDRVVERMAAEDILSDMVPEAFAAVKNACRRSCGETWEVTGQPTQWNMVPFDVQLIGGICMHYGNIAEMATGEGKTLVATMPCYLNALAGHVHVITVNDYLARRDAEWNGPMLARLGVTVGAIQSQEHDVDLRKTAYAADITYGTCSEFGFDYLRDNMKPQREMQVQGPLDYAIIDEVDSILIDEARTPLIISGPTSGNVHQYAEYKPLVQQLVNRQTRVVQDILNKAETLVEEGNLDEAGEELWKAQEAAPRNKRLMALVQKPGVGRALNQATGRIKGEQRHHALREELYYYMEEGRRSVNFTDRAQQEFPQLRAFDDGSPTDDEQDAPPPAEADMSDPEAYRKQIEEEEKLRAWSEKMHNINQLIVAYSFYEKDVHYIVQDNKVVIVDEFTGRLMPGRQWSDGLHQAVEAKEGVDIREETQTLATITLQNFFRLYKKLAGMTGTAATEANEFSKIYGLGVVVVPTNKPIVRDDRPDRVYPTAKAKFKAIVDEIAEANERGQPVLVGTIAVEKSELISRMLRRKGVDHEILNAKQHEREAHIVQKAGQKGSVTIATNMAGRGTDIKLGEGVVDLGGLYVIGTERHEARRIDNQLRGRSGRQGDPGASVFFLSLEDDLMRVFASDWVRNFLARMGFTGDEVIDSPLVTRQVGKAQKKVEERNFGIRENLLKYDTVMDEQRWDIYNFRQSILDEHGQSDILMDMYSRAFGDQIDRAPAADDTGSPNVNMLSELLFRRYGVRVPPTQLEGKDRDGMVAAAMEHLRKQYEQRERFFGPRQMRMIERYVMLNSIDNRWKDHLYAMDALRDAVGLVGYAQKDPYIEFSKGAHELYEQMSVAIREDIASVLLRVSVERERPREDIWEISQQSGVSETPEQFRQQQEAAIAGSGQGEEKAQPFVRRDDKVGRNEPCPCGSGKKYKQCCGKRAV